VKRRGRSASVLGLLAAVAWGGGCAAVFGLDGYEDAASALCACPGFDFEKVDACEAQAREQLTAATAAEREAWLASYEAKQCGALCERSAECYGELPGCVGKKAGCECCAWNDVVLECKAGACQACRTCSEIALKPDDGVFPCVSARARLGVLESCACKACQDDCTGFCQKIDLLSDDPTNGCRACLDANCKDAVDACLEDAP
jgi:hypothetical protein